MTFMQQEFLSEELECVLEKAAPKSRANFFFVWMWVLISTYLNVFTEFRLSDQYLKLQIQLLLEFFPRTMSSLPWWKKSLLARDSFI